MICCTGNDPTLNPILNPQYFALRPPSATCIALPPNSTMMTCNTEVVNKIPTNNMFLNNPLKILTTGDVMRWKAQKSVEIIKMNKNSNVV